MFLVFVNFDKFLFLYKFIHFGLYIFCKLVISYFEVNFYYFLVIYFLSINFDSVIPYFRMNVHTNFQQN